MVLLTLSTCYYNIKSKFPPTKYLAWAKNLLSIVNNFNLVIYTDRKSFGLFKTLFTINPSITNKIGTKIKVIIKPLEDFVGYKYKDHWIKNHSLSGLDLHEKVDWSLNMLWCEKVHFVNETVNNKYFVSPFYGWCDIGYFRNRKDDSNTNMLLNWPNPLKLFTLTKGIHYACVENNQEIFKDLIGNNRSKPLSKDKLSQKCFAGGFFITRPRLIQTFSTIFDNKLQYYFDNEFVVKDDQTILLDCIANNPRLFCLHLEQDLNYDNWFMFQRLLL
jgi:hypothetical protein